MTTLSKAFAGFTIKNATRGEVEAVVATLDVVDHEGDVIETEAIRSGARVKMSAYGHDVLHGNLPVGAGTVSIDRGRALFSGRLFLQTARGRDTFEVLKELGPDSEWSIGFRIVREEPPPRPWADRGARRLLKELTVLEVSPVLLGAGIGTQTTRVKTTSVAERGGPSQPHRADLATILAQHLERLDDAYPTEVAERPDRHQLAVQVAYWAAKQWGIDPPTVRWFAGATISTTTGRFYPGSRDIWLRSGLTELATVRATCHEVSHFARDVRNLPNTEPAVLADEQLLMARFHLDLHSGRILPR